MIIIDIFKKLSTANGELPLEISLDITSKEFVTVMGKSGSGKSTFLRILAGLEEARGNIKVEESLWMSERFFLPPQKREIGFVMQSYALFENMTVKQNLLYVQNDKVLANKLLEMTEIQNLAKRYPKTLSGGQQQRVALCRALMKKPKLLLLDEPFSALDASMRQKLQQELLTLHEEFQTTTIMVTHDKEEAYRMGSRIIEIDNGKIVSDKTKKELSQTQQNFIEATLIDLYPSGAIYIGVMLVGSEIIHLPLDATQAKSYEKGKRYPVVLGGVV